MSLTVFLTGPSGYIGGQVLHTLATTHPELAIRVLVRDATKSKAIKAAYPNVQIVAGTLDEDKLISEESQRADIILNLAATGHLKSVQAIHEGLKGRKSGSPAHWIQVSGASALAAGELADKEYIPGSPSDAIYDDLEGVADIRDLIKAYPTRAVDNYILTVAESSQINTALVLPPIIYGPGQGPVNQRSIQIPSLAKATLQRGRGLQVGRGLSCWGNVHIQDLADVYLALVEQAMEKEIKDDVWNLDGIYLVGHEEMPFSEISKRVAASAAEQGWIPNDEVDSILGDEANTLLPHGTVLFATNARSNARRAKEQLGWRPAHIDGLKAEIGRAVKEEAKLLAIA